MLKQYFTTTSFNFTFIGEINTLRSEIYALK